jgi:predicted nucleic acid-binding Zn ribbon protein
MICSNRARRGNSHEERRSFMFLILAVVLVLLWLGGFFVLHVSSFLIHLLLIFALISIIMNFVGGRRAV